MGERSLRSMSEFGLRSVGKLGLRSVGELGLRSVGELEDSTMVTDYGPSQTFYPKLPLLCPNTGPEHRSFSKSSKTHGQWQFRHLNPAAERRGETVQLMRLMLYKHNDLSVAPRTHWAGLMLIIPMEMEAGRTPNS